MIALILAAGYGTRLYPVVRDTPKPLLPIADRTLIDFLMDKVKGLPDLSRVVVVTNEKFHGQFVEWAKGYASWAAPVEVVNDGTRTPEERLGSVGDIRFVIQQCGIDEDLLVLGGDNLFDYALDDFVAQARVSADQVTIGLYDIGDREAAKNFGVVELAEDTGRVMTFEEKPAAPRSTLIAMCSYYFPRASLDLIETYIQQTRNTDKAGDYIHWLTVYHGVCGVQFEGQWYDIGSVKALREAQKAFGGA